MIYFVIVLKNIFQDVRNVRNVRFWYAIIILEKVEAGRFLTVRKSRPYLGRPFLLRLCHGFEHAAGGGFAVFGKLALPCAL